VDPVTGASRDEVKREQLRRTEAFLDLC
jgi:hypothetical protein